LNVSNQSHDAAVLFPDLLEKKPTADGVVLALRIPEGLAYFTGHFDEIPIVPGVAQIQWAVHYGRQYLGVSQTFSHMEAVKFKELLMPGQHVQLDLRYLKEAYKLEFCYRSVSCEYSSGRIYFHDDRL
jgi:3-hydroxymyristoyl/3-hydroxydecanoyl-(acyl carrier protein) dehydratase